MTRAPIYALGLVFLGIGLIIGGVAAFPHAGESAYEHSVERVNESAVPAESEVLAYENLSTSGQTVFLKALNSSEGQYTAYGEENAAPEFRYSDEETAYYVEYESEYYLLRTLSGISLGFDRVIRSLLVLFGVLAVGAGAYRYWTTDFAE